MTSSASTPSTMSSGQPCARTSSCSGAICRDEIVRHRRRGSPCTAGYHVVAERLAGRVEDDGEIVRLAVLDQSAQHRQHSAQRAGRLARASAQIGKRVERPIQIRRPIHQHERRHASDSQDSGAHRSARTQHDQRAGSVAGAGNYGRVRHRDGAAARHPSRGKHVRKRAHQGGTSVLREDARPSRGCCPMRASP